MSARSREGLEQALRSLGLRCRIEEWDALAVAIPDSDAPRATFENDDLRRRALEAARAHGFSHLALELCDGAPGAVPGAALSGD